MVAALRRTLAIAVVAAQLGALATSSLAAGAGAVAEPPPAEHAHAGHSGDGDARPAAPSHCTEHRPPPAVHASAPCPCGCDDGSEPRATPLPAGSALLGSATRVAPPARGPRLPALSAALPPTPVRGPDPIPI